MTPEETQEVSVLNFKLEGLIAQCAVLADALSRAEADHDAAQAELRQARRDLAAFAKGEGAQNLLSQVEDLRYQVERANKKYAHQKKIAEAFSREHSARTTALFAAEALVEVLRAGGGE